MSIAVLPVACSEPTSFGASECTNVDASVTAVGTIVLDWSPDCPVAMVLIEKDASDVWAISGPLDDQNPGTANMILPPVVYGQAPSGTYVIQPPLPLTEGETYELILWRTLPEGSTVECAANNGNFCMVALREFTP